MGGLRQIDPDEAIARKIEKQERERETAAYDKGKEGYKRNQQQPEKSGSPKGDGYDKMTKREKEAYKKGHRGG